MEYSTKNAHDTNVSVLSMICLMKVQPLPVSSHGKMQMTNLLSGFLESRCDTIEEAFQHLNDLRYSFRQMKYTRKTTRTKINRFFTIFKKFLLFLK